MSRCIRQISLQRILVRGERNTSRQVFRAKSFRQDVELHQASLPIIMKPRLKSKDFKKFLQVRELQRPATFNQNVSIALIIGIAFKNAHSCQYWFRFIDISGKKFTKILMQGQNGLLLIPPVVFTSVYIVPR